MPVGPPELTAEVSVDDAFEGSPTDLATAAGAAEIAVDAGPGVAGLSGDRDSVLSAITRLVEAAIDSGAREIHVNVHVPETGSFPNQPHQM